MTRWLQATACFALFAAVLAGLSCASNTSTGANAQARMAGRGDVVALEGWRRLRSPWFTIVSDVAEPALLQLGADLERFVGVVRETTSIDALQPRIPTRIYIFSEFDDYARFRSNPNNAGEFTRTRDQNVMLFSLASTAARNRAVLFHEFVHHLLRNSENAGYPLWYEEGMAELLGAVSWRDDAIAVGMVPHGRRSAFALEEWIPVAELLAARTTEGMEPAYGHLFYAEAWALVHYLHVSGDARRAQLVRYVELDRQGLGWRDAFARSFDVDVEALDAELRQHWERLRTRVRFLNLQAGLLEVNEEWSVESVPPATIATDLAGLGLLHGSERIELVHALVESGLEREPDDAHLLALRALCLDAKDDPDGAESALGAALAAAPDASFVHLARGRLALAHATSAEPVDPAAVETARATLRRSVELDPDAVEPLATLGLSYAEAKWGGDAAEGLRILERAAALAPWSADLHLAIGLLHARLGHRAQAVAYLEAVARGDVHPELSARASKALDMLDDGPLGGSAAPTHTEQGGAPSSDEPNGNTGGAARGDAQR